MVKVNNKDTRTTSMLAGYSYGGYLDYKSGIFVEIKSF